MQETPRLPTEADKEKPGRLGPAFLGFRIVRSGGEPLTTRLITHLGGPGSDISHSVGSGGRVSPFLSR